MYTDIFILGGINLLFMVAKVIILFLLVVVFDAVIWRDFSFKRAVSEGNIAAAIFLGLTLLGAFFSTSLR